MGDRTLSLSTGNASRSPSICAETHITQVPPLCYSCTSDSSLKADTTPGTATEMTQGAETPDIRNAREALFDAEAKKEVAWRAALRDYTPTGATSFVDALSHNKAYLDAWEIEQQRYDEYKSLQTPEMEDMLKQLDIMKSANDRLLYKKRSVLALQVFSIKLG